MRLGARRGASHSRRPHLTSLPFPEAALFFAHDYCPGAQTLADKYLRSRGPPLPEGRLWSIIVQVASALRSVHSHRMAARVVSAQRILVTGFHRCGHTRREICRLR